jgi:hypothetical protein
MRSALKMQIGNSGESVVGPAHRHEHDRSRLFRDGIGLGCFWGRHCGPRIGLPIASVDPNRRQQPAPPICELARGDRFVRCGFDLLRSALTHTERCGAGCSGVRTLGCDASLAGSFQPSSDQVDAPSGFGVRVSSSPQLSIRHSIPPAACRSVLSIAHLYICPPDRPRSLSRSKSGLGRTSPRRNLGSWR